MLDIFDDYGNLIGKIAPNGDGPFFVLFVVSLWISGFLFYAIARLLVSVAEQFANLIQEGFMAIQEQEYLKAFYHLVIPVLVIGCLLLGLTVSISKRINNYFDPIVQKEIRRIEQNSFEESFLIVETGKFGVVNEGVSYDFINNSTLDVKVVIVGCKMIRDKVVTPGDTLPFYCPWPRQPAKMYVYFGFHLLKTIVY